MLLNKSRKIFYSNCRNIRSSWTLTLYIRKKSSIEPKIKTYSHTIISPKTNFPARVSHAGTEDIQKTARFSELYNWQREHLKGPEYVLHDGPPYANGDLHMGHAVNKIIKDINNRSQVLQGNKVHYRPGWDCHGLPIELKALQANRAHKNASDPVVTRQIARSFALDTVEKQKCSFESWGVMADWQQECYMTLNKNYVQSQLRQFLIMYKKKLVFRALKPVYWSPSSMTALAEAELEYDPQFKSKEVYVKFPMEKLPEAVHNVSTSKLSALIWTTTPWTLVANKAIAFNSQMVYSVVTINTKPEELFLIAKDQIEELEKVLGAEIRALVDFDGYHLKGSTYKSVLTNEILPFLDADHVTKGKGTGLVHTAPAHGPEDFLVALKNNITVNCNVDEQGRYKNLGHDFDGLEVLTDGQEAVISKLQGYIVQQGTYIHSYPLDWRTKKPVIIRASDQWFIDTAAVKDKALAALDKLKVLPTSTADQSRQGFRAQVEKRPYWCISRQRAWGVPIPVLHCGSDVIVDEGVIEKLCTLIDERGTDVWWTCDVNELVTDDFRNKYGLGDKTVTKGKDIMDIWLDAGLSWQTLGGRKARLYSEGVDQLTGWFQASLLTSIALRDEPPYESIFVHGFVVDEKKRKMSKSIGNVIDPKTIIHGDKKQPAYGIDTLRWWVASHATQHSQIVISKKLLEDSQTEVIRIRNIIKYLLGVIGDLDKEQFELKPHLNFFDQYLILECHTFLDQINDSYNNFRYNNVSQLILFFISNKVSGLYCHCVKDRLYCSPKSSMERLAAQLVVHTILVTICKALGPILPHLVEETWQHHPLHKNPFYFTTDIPILPPKDMETSIMDAILDMKRDMCVQAKNENLKKFNLNLTVESHLYEKLNELTKTDGVNDSVLCEILEVASVSLENGAKKWQIELSQSNKSQCLRCRKYNALVDSDKCLRCEQAIALL